MKKILAIILCVLLCAGIGGLAYTLTKDLNTNTKIEQPNDGNSDSTGDKTPNVDDTEYEKPDNGGSTDEGDNGEISKELVAAPNEVSLIKEGMDMVSGAQIYLGEEEYEPAIRFTFNVSSAVKAEVDATENKQLAFLVAPLNYFDSVNPNNYTYIDWVTAFNEAGKTVIWSPLEEGNFIENGDDYIVRFRLQNVLYKNINREFVCMLVLANTSGNTTTYQYNSYQSGVTYRSNARSVAYVAAASLNAHTLGMEAFNQNDLERVKGYINQSVDIANGLEEATNDNSMYAFTVNPSSPQKLSIGETFKVVVEIVQDVNVPVWYRSSDESVVTVDANGNVVAKKAGTAVIAVYIAGEAVGITVTVF